jgi:hypothetical protein
VSYAAKLKASMPPPVEDLSPPPGLEKAWAFLTDDKKRAIIADRKAKQPPAPAGQPGVPGEAKRQADAARQKKEDDLQAQIVAITSTGIRLEMPVSLTEEEQANYPTVTWKEMRLRKELKKLSELKSKRDGYLARLKSTQQRASVTQKIIDDATDRLQKSFEEVQELKKKLADFE